jgi:hypothetical protein
MNARTPAIVVGGRKVNPMRLATPISAILMAAAVACGSTAYSGPTCDPCTDTNVADSSDGPQMAVACAADGTPCSPGTACICVCGKEFACGPNLDGVTVDCSISGPVCKYGEPSCSPCPPCPVGTSPDFINPCNGCGCSYTSSSSGGAPTNSDASGPDSSVDANRSSADGSDAPSSGIRDDGGGVLCDGALEAGCD